MGQIARRIAELLGREKPKEVADLGGADADATEAAGLAHDLGHPPFGHIAEEELHRLVQASVDGYEGNAQTFRIVVELTSSDALDADDQSLKGLNLTRQTLDGILKYPWAHRENPEYPKKWGYYQAEKPAFEWLRADCPPKQRSLIAEIMDWADDLTFAIHDLLDFFCAGRIPIDRCKGNSSLEFKRMTDGMFSRKPKWLDERALYEEALVGIVDTFPFGPNERFTDSRSDREKLFQFSTGLIRRYVHSFELRHPGDSSGRLVQIDPEAQREVEVMKQFTWEYVILNPDLAVPQEGQRAAIRTVFERLLEAAQKRDSHLFPPRYRETIKQAEGREAHLRTVADCVSGMTEKEVVHFYRCLQGLNQ